jgi:hypothetical protein
LKTLKYFAFFLLVEHTDTYEYIPKAGEITDACKKRLLNIPDFICSGH